jgi:hypothetical protein
MDGSFVRKDICGVMHNTMSHEIKALRDDLKSMSDKIDRLIESKHG